MATHSEQTASAQGEWQKTCVAEVAALHEVVLDDGEVLLDEGSKHGALAVRAQLHSSIQRVGILRSLSDVGTLQSCLLVIQSEV